MTRTARRWRFDAGPLSPSLRRLWRIPRVFVHVARIANHRLDELTRPDVVHQIAEEMTAERVVAKILDDRSAVGEGFRARQLLGGRARITLQQQRGEM